MRAFRFRLEKVLQLRRQIEEGRRRELSLMLFDLRQHEARFHSLQHDLQSCKENMTNDLEQREIPMAKIEVFAAYMKRLTSAIEAERDEIADLNKRIEAKRADLLESIKERKAMESVRAKRQAEYYAESTREETRFLDEIAGWSQANSEHRELF